MSDSERTSTNFNPRFSNSCLTPNKTAKKCDQIFFNLQDIDDSVDCGKITNDDDNIHTRIDQIDLELNENRLNGNGDTVARKRWNILAKALTKRMLRETNEISIRRFTSFNLLSPTRLNGNWYLYRSQDREYEIKVYHLQGHFTARDLIGFNNTGNICIWPSEETLALFCLENLQFFKEKTVLELGGGMSCLAGLMVAKYSDALFIHLTDGNTKSIENVHTIVDMNNLSEKVFLSPLQWQQHNSNIGKKYDVILVADCLFFEDVRFHLINTIWLYLTDDGIAFVMAPERGQTLCDFVKESEEFGFKCVRENVYNNIVWRRHLDLLKTNSFYDPALHYPILLKLTK